MQNVIHPPIYAVLVHRPASTSTFPCQPPVALRPFRVVRYPVGLALNRVGGKWLEGQKNLVVLWDQGFGRFHDGASTGRGLSFVWEDSTVNDA